MNPFLLLIWLALVSPSMGAGNPFSIKTEYGAKSPVPAGAEVILKLPVKVRIGDAIMGTFTVRNSGTDPFEISIGGDYRSTGFPLRLKIQVTDAQGNVLPDANQGSGDFGGLMGPTKLTPGATHDINFPLPSYVTFPGAGIYTVEACHDLGWIVDAAHPHPVAKTLIEIVMPTVEEAAVRVHDLCTGEGEDRLFVLRKLAHEIFLPSLLREAESGNADAVTGIAGIRGTAPFETLLHLLENPAPSASHH